MEMKFNTKNIYLKKMRLSLDEIQNYRERPRRDVTIFQLLIHLCFFKCELFTIVQWTFLLIG